MTAILAQRKTFLGAKRFNCMFLLCHMQVLELIYSLLLPECQGTPCSKQTRYLKF